MTQEKIDLNLNSLVAFLTTRGTKASTATIKRLNKASAVTLERLIRESAASAMSQEITDADRRDLLYFRQAGVLAATVKELKTFLIDPDAYPRPQWAHIVLRLVYKIVASSSILARRCIDDELADQLLNREHKYLGAAKARKGLSDKTQPRDKLILELAKEIRFLSSKKKKCGSVAREVFKDKRLTDSKEWKAKPMELGGVDAVVRKHWLRLSPSLPKRAKPR
jgi:hypothetical protein